MAARFEEPQLRCILGIGQDVGFCTEPEARMLQSLVLSNHKVIPQNYGSSRILVPYAEIRARQRERRKAPVLFRVSRDSRAIAKTVYSLQPYNDNPNRKLRFTGRLKDGAAFMSRKMLYVNTLYDQFYLGNAESMWKQYKVHVDLLLKLNFRKSCWRKCWKMELLLQDLISRRFRQQQRWSRPVRSVNHQTSVCSFRYFPNRSHSYLERIQKASGFYYCNGAWWFWIR